MAAGGEPPAYDYLFKLIVIGDAGTGKSCLVHQFLERRYRSDGAHTVGVEFGSRALPARPCTLQLPPPPPQNAQVSKQLRAAGIIECGGQRVKLQIWDTAGQERFRSVTRSYYRGAMGALVVFDVTSRESYDHVPEWVRDARALAAPDLVVMLVGNKVDLVESSGGVDGGHVGDVGGGGAVRQVPFLDSSALAQEQHAMLLEASARTGASVEEIFAMVAKAVLSKRVDTAGAAVGRGAVPLRGGGGAREKCSGGGGGRC
jgi:small GTP-binding protein